MACGIAPSRVGRGDACWALGRDRPKGGVADGWGGGRAPAGCGGGASPPTPTGSGSGIGVGGPCPPFPPPGLGGGDEPLLPADEAEHGDPRGLVHHAARRGGEGPADPRWKASSPRNRSRRNPPRGDLPRDPGAGEGRESLWPEKNIRSVKKTIHLISIISVLLPPGWPGKSPNGTPPPPENEGLQIRDPGALHLCFCSNHPTWSGSHEKFWQPDCRNLCVCIYLAFPFAAAVLCRSPVCVLLGRCVTTG